MQPSSRSHISSVGVFSSHGYLRSQVHAAIENVGLKEVWLKIAGGEKAMRPGDWGNPSPLGFVVSRNSVFSGRISW